jgi:hypothetical protein
MSPKTVRLIPAAACVSWVLLKLLLEWIWPCIPFVTNNGFIRILMDAPFYFGIVYSIHGVTGHDISREDWLLAILTAVLQALLLASVLWIVLFVRQRKARRRTERGAFEVRP